VVVATGLITGGDVLMFDGSEVRSGAATARLLLQLPAAGKQLRDAEPEKLAVHPVVRETRSQLAARSDACLSRKPSASCLSVRRSPWANASAGALRKRVLGAVSQLLAGVSCGWQLPALDVEGLSDLRPFCLYPEFGEGRTKLGFEEAIDRLL
jgi:hypothetical protein